MLNDLHDAIRRLLFMRGQLPQPDVDVRFDTPTKEWISSLIRPTVSVFLYDIQENLELRHTSFQTRREGSRAFTKADPRLFDFRFMVSVISTEVEDEHMILYRVLYTLLKHTELDQEFLPEGLRNTSVGVLCRVDQPSETSSRLTDIWNAIEVPPRPALTYVVTLPVDTEETFEAPLVLTRSARYRSTLSRTGNVDQVRYHIGGFVRDQNGTPFEVLVALSKSAQQVTSDPEGRFVFFGVPEGRIELNVTVAGKTKTFGFEVPATNYDINLEVKSGS